MSPLVVAVVGSMLVTATVLLSSRRLLLRLSGEKGTAVALGALGLVLVAVVTTNALYIDSSKRIGRLERPSPRAQEVRLQGDIAVCRGDSAAGRACRRSLVLLLERGLREREAQRRAAERRERLRALQRRARRLDDLLRSPRLTPAPRPSREAPRPRPVRRVARTRTPTRRSAPGQRRRSPAPSRSSPSPAPPLASAPVQRNRTDGSHPVRRGGRPRFKDDAKDEAKAEAKAEGKGNPQGGNGRGRKDGKRG